MIDLIVAQQVFDQVTNHQKSSKTDSKVALSQLYLSGKITLPVFNIVSDRIHRMCGNNDAIIY